jgi:hypothetical protein
MFPVKKVEWLGSDGRRLAATRYTDEVACRNWSFGYSVDPDRFDWPDRDC